MLKHFKTFFYPGVLTYSYNLPKELIIAKITDVLLKKVTFFSSNDMKGRFLSPETFAINTAPFANTNGVKYGSTLVGHIIENEKGITTIKTRAKPALVFYFLFFLAIISGLLYLYRFIQTGSTQVLIGSLAALFLGPALSIGFSNVAIHSIRERYKMYIDKELRSGNTGSDM